jgi:Fusaric acid resistance protein-like
MFGASGVRRFCKTCAQQLAVIASDKVIVRRGALFFFNIGIPVVAGVFSGNLQPTAAAAVLGMALSFADNDAALPGRLRILVFDAAAIAVSGGAGYLSAKVPAIYWTVLICLTLAIGFAASQGREAVVIGRHCGIAFVVAAAIPLFTATTLLYLAAVVLLNAATRSADYLAFGRLPLLPQVPLQKPESAGGWIRFSLAFAATAAIGMYIGDQLGTQHGYWIVITTVLVMQPDVRSSFLRIVQRIGGTLAGVVAAWVVSAGIHSVAANCAAILVVAPLIPHHLTRRYWLHTGLIALLVLLAYDLALFNSQGLGLLPLERIQDILIGCALALIGTAAAFPRAFMAQVVAVAAGRARRQ